MKAGITIAFIGVSLATIQPKINAQTYLNYNQPYVNSPNVKTLFLSKSDNDNFWEVLKSIREKKVGYEDTEFNTKLDWCRYVGESAVL